MAKKAQLDEVRPILNDVNEGINVVENVLDAVEHGADKATGALEHGLEKVADVVPEALDKSVHVAAEGTRTVVRQFQSPKKLILLTSLGGVVVGAGLGYLGYRLLKKQLTAKIRAEFQEKLETELDNTRKFYEKREERREANKQRFATPAEAAEALIKTTEDELAEEAGKALADYESTEEPIGVVQHDPREGRNSRVRYDQIAKTGPTVPQPKSPTEAPEAEVVAEEIVRNVFVQQASIDDWDQDAEEASRNPAVPYVISHDEYLENAYQHEQDTLTWYAGDEILTDAREQLLDDTLAIVGPNMDKFGHGSRDSSVVYIRNERIETDFEVTMKQGSYAEEVAGFEHADVPRFRHGRRGDGG